MVYAIHGLRTPNEGKNQRNPKFWADVADKICFSRTYKQGNNPNYTQGVDILDHNLL